MSGALYDPYDILNTYFDRDQEHLAAEALHSLCLEAVLSHVPSVEVEWHAHQLRRRLTEQYRAIGYVLNEGQYSMPGLLDVIGELVAERVVS